MPEEMRQMWKDLYLFFEKCASTSVKSAQWQQLGQEAFRILAAYKEDMFVREVLAVTMAYWLDKAITMKVEEKSA